MLQFFYLITHSFYAKFEPRDNSEEFCQLNGSNSFSVKVLNFPAGKIKSHKLFPILQSLLNSREQQNQLNE